MVLARLFTSLGALLVCAAALGACGSTPAGTPDAGDGVTMSCDDGTGRTSCCIPAVTSGTPCSSEGTSECWTRCSSGFTGHFLCSGDDSWLAGHGLFPCDADAGSAD